MRAPHKVDAGWRKGSPLAFIVLGSVLAALTVFWFLLADDSRATATTEDGGIVTTTESAVPTSS